MKIKQVLIISGAMFQVAILSVTLYFLHEVNQKGEEGFDESQDEMMVISEESVVRGVKVPFQQFVMGPGRVCPSKCVKVSVKREGIVESLGVSEGDYVRVGEPLMRIDSEMLSFAFKETIADYEVSLAELQVSESEILKAALRKKEVSVMAAERAISDCKVSSPAEGRILKINVNPGEYIAPSDVALVIGSDHPLHCNVLMDEREMWRITPSKNLRAIAMHKINPEIHFVLDFVAVKPSISSEGKVEMVFAFDKGKAPLYLDQVLDVYIEAAAPGDTSYLDYQFTKK